MVNGVKFRRGVANPYTARNPAVLGPEHLDALYTIQASVDGSSLDQDLAVDEAAFVLRFRNKNILANLKVLLDCWVRTSSGGDVMVISDFAALSFYENASKRLVADEKEKQSNRSSRYGKRNQIPLGRAL